MGDLNKIPRIGPKTIAKLHHLGIYQSQDLIYHFPHRYLDFSRRIDINKVSENENVTICGRIINIQNIYTRSHKNIQKATIEDKTGQITIIWFNQPYLSRLLAINSVYSFAGSVTVYQNKKTLISPAYGQYNTGKIIAVYPETKGLNSNWFRKTISENLKSIISNIPEPLPLKIINQHHLLPLKTAFKQIHQPSNHQLLERSRFRLALNEILSLQSTALLKKNAWSQKKPHHCFETNPIIEKKISRFINSLPFKLSQSQNDAWKDIKNDLLLNRPANRLLQGDVGSGKTIVAILACLLARLNRSVSLLIAPTDILARQHQATFEKLLNIKIILLTAKNKIKVSKIPTNSIIISTHAAIYQKETLAQKVSLLIIDEQHKFGVAQRSFLINQQNPPHCITMTATPIPRTISLTLLGNLDLSIIKQLPENRPTVKTYLVPSYKYQKCYQWLRDLIKQQHQQAFIVCPFIEASETLQSVKSAKELFLHLQQDIFSDLKLALIHGKIKNNDRNDIMAQFARNQINILVTTPIIEVGIDFPNATTIIIHSADRFGLAQLHQLRGRVGRSLLQSYCYLFSETDNHKALERLKMFSKTNNGQKIAEYDLKTRGPGEAFSFIQHGFPSLKIADLSNYHLIQLGQQIIKEIGANHQSNNYLPSSKTSVIISPYDSTS